MKRKIFTLLTLLLAVCSGAWADVNTTLIDGITLPGLPAGTYTGGTTVSHNGTNTAVVLDANDNGVMEAVAPGYGSPTADNFTWTNAANGSDDASWSTTGTTWDAPNGSLFVGSTAYTTKENAHYVNFARRGNLRTNRTFAYRFTNCEGVSALVKSQGTSDDAAACLAVYEVGTGNVLTSAGSASSKEKAVDVITVDGLSSSKTYVAYIYGMNGSNGELYEVAFLAPSSGPSLKASPASVTLAATESGVAVNSSFTITGANLTAGTYNLTIPSVEGLEVSPTSFTVAANGTVSQEVNVSYSSTENVPANTVNITATVNEVNLSVEVNYSSSVATWELQVINSARTWDFSTLSGGKNYSGDDLNVEHVYANIAEITCPAEFDGTALAFTGEYPLREGKGIAQNGALRFITSVPGYIVVTFSDTGTKASATAVKRYLCVSGETTEYWASRENNGDDPYEARLDVTTGAIPVSPLGDVAIYGTSALVYKKVVFTPVTSISGTLPSSGIGTLASAYALDFTNASGVEAYKVSSVSNTSATLEKVTGAVAAGTGLIIVGAKNGEYTIPVVAEGSEVASNKLVGAVTATTLEDGTFYILQNGAFHLVENTANEAARTVPAGKAYLPANVNGARAISLSFGEVTGISKAAAEVTAPAVGKFVKNGKLVIVKDGNEFNANGQLVK